MHTRISFLLICIFVSINFLFSQGKATFAPEKPKIGDVIKIKYDPKGSPLESASNIMARIMAIKDDQSLDVIEVNLELKNSIWIGDYKNDSISSAYLLVNFEGDKKIDDNNGDSWDLQIFNEEGKPVLSSFNSVGMISLFGGRTGFKKITDRDKAIECFKKELALYPDNFSSRLMIWENWISKNAGGDTLKNICSEIKRLYEDNKIEEGLVSNTIDILKSLGDTVYSEKIYENELKRRPYGSIAKMILNQNISMEKDEKKRVEKILDFILNYDLSFAQRDMSLRSLLSFCRKNNDWKYVDTFLLKNKIKDGTFYANISSYMLSDITRIDMAMDLAKEAIKLLSFPDNKMKPAYISLREWKEKMLFYYMFSAKSNLASGYIKTSKLDSAEAILLDLSKKDDESKVRCASILIECYKKAGKYDEAFEVGKEALALGGVSSPKIIQDFKQIYIQVKGSEKGYNELFEELKNISNRKNKKKIIKAIINKKAPDFELKSLDGQTIKLSELKGKVIILDFWATWCGPCVASFPFLQKVYNKYKGNSDVLIFAIDTFEKGTFEEKNERIEKFMEKNKYTFPILIDDGKTADKYGVTRIPDGFIIDKDGIIQFKYLGYGNLDELDLLIEVLLNSEHKNK